MRTLIVALLFTTALAAQRGGGMGRGMGGFRGAGGYAGGGFVRAPGSVGRVGGYNRGYVGGYNRGFVGGYHRGYPASRAYYGGGFYRRGFYPYGYGVYPAGLYAYGGWYGSPYWGFSASYGAPYGYGYGGYGYGGSPVVTVVTTPPPDNPPSTIIINSDHHRVQRSVDTAEPAPSASRGTRSPIYLIATTEGTLWAAAAYWVEEGVLHFITLKNEHRQMPLARLDRALTEQVNKERGLSLSLPR